MKQASRSSATPRRGEPAPARTVFPGCWCMFPRRNSAEGSTSGEPNRRAFKKIVAAGPPPGLLAYDGGDPVGWVAIAPRSEYVRFERSRVLKPVDDQPVWSVPCFFIARTHRARGSARMPSRVPAKASEREPSRVPTRASAPKPAPRG